MSKNSVPFNAMSTKPTSHYVMPQTCDDVLNSYIREIANIPVLTAEEE